MSRSDTTRSRDEAVSGRLTDADEAVLDRALNVAEDGTSFVYPALGPTEPAHSWPGEQNAARPLRILCVDDNKDAADTLAAVLEMLGCQAQACYNGASALAAVRAAPPDICLLDLSMPGMDGLELAGHIRAGVGPRPLLLIAATALGDIDHKARTALAGFHEHLIKPIDIAILRALIDRYRAVLRRRPDHTSPAE